MKPGMFADGVRNGVRDSPAVKVTSSSRTNDHVAMTCSNLGCDLGKRYRGVRAGLALSAPVFTQSVTQSLSQHGSVVGSMTHCDGYRGCAVALRRRVLATGVDAVPHAPLPAGVLEAVASAEERTALRALSATHPDVCWDRLLFSAKEAVYKAWFPLTARWLDFYDARINFDPAASTFHAHLFVDGPVTSSGRLTGFSGRWMVGHGLAATAIVVHAPNADPLSPISPVG